MRGGALLSTQVCMSPSWPAKKLLCKFGVNLHLEALLFFCRGFLIPYCLTQVELSYIKTKMVSCMMVLLFWGMGSERCFYCGTCTMFTKY